MSDLEITYIFPIKVRTYYRKRYLWKGDRHEAAFNNSLLLLLDESTSKLLYSFE